MIYKVSGTYPAFLLSDVAFHRISDDIFEGGRGGGKNMA